VNALLKAKSAYSAAKTPTRTAKNFEYEVVARVTRRLITAAQNSRDEFSELAVALNDNRKLWSIFTADIASKGNPLPDDLKQNLFELAEFTRQHTSKVLQRKANIRPLVEINTAIMRGLRSGAS